MADTVEVRVRDCACPDHFHNGTGDLVYLRTSPSLQLGLAVQADIRAALGDGELLKQAWLISYVKHGVVGWNLVDARGKPRPLDVQELLDDFDMGLAIAEKADELYGDRVVTPFVQKLLTLLGPGQTDDSTSPNLGSTETPPEPSSPATTADSQPSTE